MISIRSLLNWLVILGVNLPLVVMIQTATAQVAMAQIVPDETLGSENSRVRRATVRDRRTEVDRDADLIEGGAVRGRNLFHSFREFGVREGDAAYFANPENIQNIFGRVTGSNPSNILGTLGVDGAANLFLLNPNGIVFGPNASLDVQGSFVGSTANSFLFADGSEFSAINPQASPLLTVSVPVGLQYGTAPGEIVVEAAILEGGIGKTLTLVGGNIQMDFADLSAPGGQIEIGSTANGIVELAQDGGLFGLSFPQTTGRGEVSIADTILATTADEEGASGDIRINTGSLTVTEGSILSSESFGEDAPGEIIINASDVVELDGISISSSSDSSPGGNIEITAGSLLAIDSGIETSTFEGGDSGNILINVRDAAEFDSTFLSTNPLDTSGSGGNIEITAGSLSVKNESELNTATRGQGNAGNITITTREDTVIDIGRLSSSVEVNAIGNGGNIEINAAELVLFDGATLETVTNGQGNAGNITFNVNDLIFAGGDASTEAKVGARGNAGSVVVNADFFTLLDDSLLTSNTSTRGNAGSITITAREEVLINGGKISGSVLEQAEGNGGNIQIIAPTILLDNSETDPFSLSTNINGRGNGGEITFIADNISISNSVIFSALGENGIGNVGNVTIDSNNLDIKDSQVQSQAYGQGNAGNIIINARNSVNFDNVQTFSRIEAGAVGNGGNVEITADSLTLRGSNLDTETAGWGNAGNIIIDVRDSVSFQRSSALSNVGENGVGNGGNIEINANSLSVSNPPSSSTTPSFLAAETAGLGDAGNIMINTRDSVYVAAVISTAVGSTGVGNGGDIEINTNTFSTDNAGILSGVTGIGNAGDIIINASTSAVFSDGGAYSNLVNSGSGGDIRITTSALSIINGAQIFSSAEGQGRAGNITINATNRVLIDGFRSYSGRSSSLSSTSERSAFGQGGNITVNTSSFRISNGGLVSARTSSSLSGGNVIINADRFEASSGGQVVASTEGGGQAGSITLNVRDDTIFSGVDLTYANRLADFGRVGIVSPKDPLGNQGVDMQGAASGVYTNTESGSSGNGGTITLNTNSLSLIDGAQVVAFTAGTGNPGNIRIRDTDTISLDNSTISTTTNSGVALSNPIPNQGSIDIQARSLSLNNNANITASTSGRGDAGNITIRDANSINLNNSAISSAVSFEANGNGGSITFDTGILNLDRASITSSTSGQGDTGTISIQADDRVALRNNSRIESTVNQGATGDSQQIILTTPILSLRGNSAISAATGGNGQAGDIRIRGAGQVSLLNSSISTAVNADAEGQGGDINIVTDALTLDNRSNITSSTAGRGNSGRIAINAFEDITLRDRSRITNRVEQGATGNSQTIRLSTPQLSLRGRSRISAATNGNGQAGDVIVQDADVIRLLNGVISAAIEPDGIVPSTGRRNNTNTKDNQSNITLDTNSLILDNGSRITARTQGQGNAGTITINANSLSFDNGSRLTSSTDTSSQAGNIILNIAETVNLDDSDISADTTRSGRGGRINLQTQTLNLDDGAAISTTSQGNGPAGRIDIRASEQLTAEGGEITTRARQSAGGNITIIGGEIDLSESSNIRTDIERGSGNGGDITVTADSVRLQDDSDVQTRVGPNGTGDGGDIAITSDSIIAFDDSDIITEAPNRGGNITLNTPAFFGAGYQPEVDTTGNADGNGRVDLDASGTVSAGTVQTPDTSFVQNSLSELPESAIDPDSLIANSCIARTEAGGTFLVTGTGGLPPNRPGATPLSAYPTDGVRTEADAPIWREGEPIIEPQGVYQLPDGQLILSHECDP